MCQKFRYFGQGDLEPTQDLDVLSFHNSFFFSIALGVFRQSISSSNSFAPALINPEMISKQFLSPTNLLRAQAFHVHKTAQIVVVRKIEDLMIVII